MRNIAERMAAAVGLDDEAPPLERELGMELLAKANMERSSSFETVNLVGAKEVVEAARALNRSIWRIEWFARGLLNDDDREGWIQAIHNYHGAINSFLKVARADLGVAGEFSRRSTEPSPLLSYEADYLQRRSASE